MWQKRSNGLPNCLAIQLSTRRGLSEGKCIRHCGRANQPFRASVIGQDGDLCAAYAVMTSQQAQAGKTAAQARVGGKSIVGAPGTSRGGDRSIDGSLSRASKAPSSAFACYVTLDRRTKWAQKISFNRRSIMRNKFIVSGFVLALSSASAIAQITLDVSQITCAQFVQQKVGPPRLIAAWLSGFYNGKRDNRIINAQTFQANLSKLERFCYQEKNFKLPVMQAVEQLFGGSR